MVQILTASFSNTSLIDQLSLQFISCQHHLPNVPSYNHRKKDGAKYNTRKEVQILAKRPIVTRGFPYKRLFEIRLRFAE